MLAIVGGVGGVLLFFFCVNNKWGEELRIGEGVELSGN